MGRHFGTVLFRHWALDRGRIGHTRHVRSRRDAHDRTRHGLCKLDATFGRLFLSLAITALVLSDTIRTLDNSIYFSLIESALQDRAPSRYPHPAMMSSVSRDVLQILVRPVGIAGGGRIESTVAVVT